MLPHLVMQSFVLSRVVCPRDHAALVRRGDWLACEHGHEYPVVDDIPVLLRDDVPQTAHWVDELLRTAREAARAGARTAPDAPAGGVDPHVQANLAATNGYLYRPLEGQLSEYPIPRFRMPPGDGGLLLDVGCNWGRWCVAAGRNGYRPVGIDPSLDAVLAARRVTRSLGIDAGFVVGDARYLPFPAALFDAVFSYSVIQHFAKSDARAALDEVARTLRPGGLSMVQMPNRFGIRSFYHLARRGFTEGEDFDVRYWTVPELRRTFAERIGRTRVEVDGYFGLGIQSSDASILPLRFRLIVKTSEVLRSVSKILPAARYVADSVYLVSRRA